MDGKNQDQQLFKTKDKTRKGKGKGKGEGGRIQVKFQRCSLCVSTQALPTALVLNEESNDLVRKEAHQNGVDTHTLHINCGRKHFE